MSGDRIDYNIIYSIEVIIVFYLQLAILGVIGAIIGYLTNTIAVKMIFRPLNPINVPILNLKVQGLIPKRRIEIAKTIGEVVDSELVSIESIMEKFIQGSNKDELIRKLKDKIKVALEKHMPPIVPQMFKGMIMEYADEVIDKEAEAIINEALEKLIDKASLHVKISEMVEERINGFEIEKLEKLTLDIAKKELQHIELLGGVIGFVIGIIQGLIVLNIA